MDTLEPAKWNDLLSRSLVKDVFQTCEWARLMKKLYGSEPMFLVASHEGTAVGGQLFFKKKVFGMFSAYEALGGPLYNNGYGDEIISSLITHFRSLKGTALYKVIRPQCPHHFEKQFTENKFVTDPFQTFLLDLERPLDKIWTSFIQNARWGVRKGEKSGVTVAEATRWEEWTAFRSIHVGHSQAHGIAAKSTEFFRYLYDNFYPRNMVKVFIAKHDGKILAGMLFLICQDTMIYYIGASDPNYLAMSPNDPIMWHAIQWGKNNNIKLLNLEDTYPNPSSNLYGIHKFKEKWGGQLTRRDFYISGKFYLWGRSLVLNNKIFQRAYAILHEKNVI
ncbi:MAG: peptidoglycan bridge formation glycyltransferase FemA/FemB family protein [Chloroflexota bacterium]